MITEHEANRTTSVMMNRALDQSAVLTGDLQQYVIELFSCIQVFPERMRANLDLSGGLINVRGYNVGAKVQAGPSTGS
jgi:adenylosuccinate lyase